MSLKADILGHIKEAMKARDSKRLEVLRFVNAEIKNKEIQMRPKEISEDDVTQVLKRYLKQRKEAAAQFAEAGRQDLVEKETYEASVVEAYLPEMLTEDQLKPIVEEVVKATGASSMKDMGAVMKEVLEKAGAQADGKMVSTLVRAVLA
ncbi:MAG: GatB/YqeY domain-containing protein [Bdellovibrionales bacterium]